MRRIRVLQTITMLELGGAQRTALDNCELLDRSRFVVGLVCADEGDLLPEARRLPDLEVFALADLRREVRLRRDWRAYREIRAAIRAFGPDIVHTHSSKAGILGRLAARREHVPAVVHTIHGWGFGQHQLAPVRTAFLAAERLVAPMTDRFIAVAAENREQGVALGLFDRDRVSVIRSAIDLDSFRACAGGRAVRESLGVPPAAPLVVQVACFKPQKAPERFVELAARIAPRFPAAHFLLVGDGQLRPHLERARHDAGLDERLHLPGWRDDMPAVYDAADVVTLTSRFEGLPRVIVEALAARRPVVAMAVDGVGEVITDRVNGFLVREGDVATMVERVATLLADGDLRRALPVATGDRLDQFDRVTMVRQEETLYEDVLCRIGS